MKAQPTDSDPVAPGKPENGEFARLRTALRASNSGLLTLKANGGLAVEVISACRMDRVTGHPDASFENDPHHWIGLVAPEDRAAVEESLGAALRRGERASIERRIQHTDGSHRWIRFQFFPLPRPGCEATACDIVFTDITAYREAQSSRRRVLQRMCRLVTVDWLTGLNNRRGLQDTLQRFWNMGRRSQSATGVLAIDIDFFKAINDTFGHDAGDQVLIQSAQLIKGELRVEDAVFRPGGDEIVVLLPLSEPDETRAVAERLLNAFRAHEFSIGSRKIAVRVSIGAVCGLTSEYADARQLVEAADRALYRAKQGGRDRMSFAVGPEAPRPEVHPATEAVGEPSAEDAARHRITALVVDDEEAQQRLVARMLKMLGCDALTASDGESALERLRGHPSVDIVLVDLHLAAPESGLQLMERLTELDNTLVGAIITGQASLPVALDA
nr:diguanylate cyclase [Kiritimatiellia bacterium]